MVLFPPQKFSKQDLLEKKVDVLVGRPSHLNLLLICVVIKGRITEPQKFVTFFFLAILTSQNKRIKDHMQPDVDCCARKSAYFKLSGSSQINLCFRSNC